MAINFLALANKGRYGDTKLRKVAGKVSHVNPIEAEAIDSFGPMGEAWVQNVGSGTTNPQTSLPEYHLWHRHGAHTKVGKFIEGAGSGTGKSVSTRNKERENRNKYGSKYASSGGKQFYTDRLNDVLNSNIAGISSDVLEAGGTFGEENLEPGPVPDYSSYGEMIHKWKILPSSTDFKTFAPFYKSAEENKLVADSQRLDDDWDIEFGDAPVPEGGTMSTMQIKEQALANSRDKIANTKDEAITSADTANKATGTDLSSGLFGMLTTSSQKASASGFAGAGDFGAEFAEGQLVDKAESSFEDINQTRESAIETASQDSEAADLEEGELENLTAGAAVTLAGNKANIVQKIQGLHDDYNKAFHESANNWITQKFG